MNRRDEQFNPRLWSHHRLRAKGKAAGGHVP